MMSKQKPTINILDYIKCPTIRHDKYTIFTAEPATGVLYVNDASPHFIHGRMAVKGHKGGVYPDFYLDMIDRVFGAESNTIEVCSRTVQVNDKRTAFTVDMNPDFHPSKVGDAQKLEGIDSNRFNRWRADPPYNTDTAKSMYNGKLPDFMQLLYAGLRVIKPNSLMFMLIGPQNYQASPLKAKGGIRVGLIYISVIPNNETRALNIYMKLPESKQAETLTLDDWA